MKLRNNFNILLISALSTTAFAEEAPKAFSGSGEFGYSSASGNTDNQSIYARLKMNYAFANYELTGQLEANTQEENSQKTAEKYQAQVQLNTFYNEARDYYSFVGGKFKQDTFAAIDLNSVYSLGLGKKLYKTEATDLTTELGLGYETTDFTDNTSENQAVASARFNASHQYNKNVKIAQELLGTFGKDGEKYEAITSVKVKMTDAMKLSAGYKYLHNTSPAAGTKKTDTETLMTLIYDF